MNLHNETMLLPSTATQPKRTGCTAAIFGQSGTQRCQGLGDLSEGRPCGTYACEEQTTDGKTLCKKEFKGEDVKYDDAFFHNHVHLHLVIIKIATTFIDACFFQRGWMG